MTPKSAIFTAVTALLVAPLLTAGASQDCDGAHRAFREELDAHDGRLTPEGARLLRDVTSLCPRSQLATNPPGVEGSSLFQMNDPGLSAFKCGYNDVVQTSHEPTEIQVTIQYGPVTKQERDEGRADVTYHPASNVTLYEVHGTTYGLSTSSRGVGTLFVHGIAIPADPGATARAGCLAPGGPLCWASASGHTRLDPSRGTIFSLTIISRFEKCSV